ncbi:MAG: hypothetical protein JSS75_03790 [Bacteroidetes bacterium]|nr:hypothetical protein [Bacteroidota bacterium]
MIVVDSNQAELPNFDKMWNYGDPSATRAKFLEVLPKAEKSGNTEYLAELLTQIARTYSLTGKFDEAHATLDRADKLISDTMQLARVRYLLERGRTFNSSNQIDTARQLFFEAANLAMQYHIDLHAVDAIHMVAIAQPDPKDQIEWNLKGIAMAEPNEKLHGWLWALYNNIGESYLKLRDFSNAYQYFHKLAQYQTKRVGKADMYTEKDEAKCLRLLGKPADALALMQPYYSKFAEAKTPDGYISCEYAEDLEALGRHGEAKPIFSEALQLLERDDWFINNDKEQLERLKHFSSH